MSRSDSFYLSSNSDREICQEVFWSYGLSVVLKLTVGWNVKGNKTAIVYTYVAN